MLLNRTGLRCLAVILGCAMSGAKANPSANLSATPARGEAPLTVEFAGGVGNVSYFGGVMIEFGDGSRARFCEPGMDCSAATIMHVYRQRGEYVARIVGRGEGQSRELATVTVTID